MKIGWILVLAFVLPVSAWAQDAVDCKDPQDTMTMKLCAGRDFQKADQELNSAWAKYKTDAEDSDKATDKHEYVDALLDSQRAWLAYRDAECTWQGFEAHGGSLENEIVATCMAKLTRDRIKQLQIGASE